MPTFITEINDLATRGLDDDTIRVFVGTDRSQMLAVNVLEYSIKRHTTAKVEVFGMLDLPVPAPTDPRNGQRTGFSFSRFTIPALNGYKGKAIYMDADMIVMRDIRDLWNIPFDGAKIIVQQEVKHAEASTAKEGAPAARKKQCAVMLIDCAACHWKIEDIIQGFDDGKYNYDQLMSEFCILNENEVKYGVPFEWNSLEHWDQSTCLLHYTDVYTQPWTYSGHPLGYIWFNEVNRMIKEKRLTIDQIKKEVDIGYFRPSLIADLKYLSVVPGVARKFWYGYHKTNDKRLGFVAHKEVYEAKRLRTKAIKEYEAKLAAEKAA
ncbi:glycosyl transferase [Neorhizobium sp. P12A]|uniref:glycosyltransferase n=1 Tax=Neorhizobium sp. P12A TaxID=2268027 RepID=UPI0011EFE86F|nr:glycosyltransferase [Neorhizobium sp. P12A]KAA0685040.1 glycosyl transferase [Neorhizobium sp. P12A]